MITKYFPLLVFCLMSFATTSCSGGGSSNSPNANSQNNPNANGGNQNIEYQFPDGSTGNGGNLTETRVPRKINFAESGHVTVHQVNLNNQENVLHLLHNEMNTQISSSRFNELDESSFKLTRDTGYSTHRFQSLGENFIRKYTDNDSGVYGLQIGTRISVTDDNTIIADFDFETGGIKATHLPSGTISYNGTVAMSFRENTIPTHTNLFRLNADFDNSSGDIRFVYDVYENYGQMLEGDFRIDINKGTYFGNNLQLRVLDTRDGIDLQDTATIIGAFHNEGATGVSGTFFDNAKQSFGGVILGAREDTRRDQRLNEEIDELLRLQE